MDYLDPKKQSRHSTTLLTGYFLIGLAIIIGTFILVYQAYGFGVSRSGKVSQSGLVFFSSRPNPANIYFNDQLNKAQTNSRIVLPENIYDVLLTRDGYRNWKRTIEVSGGSVHHYDYPFLFPKNLVTNKIAAIAGSPNIITQSPDKRWLLVQLPEPTLKFNVYDLKNPTDAPTTIAIPENLYTKSGAAENWQLSVWADDNNHLVITHTFGAQNEYLLISRKNPDQSVNLSSTLTQKFSQLTLINKKYDQYYLLSQPSGTLSKTTLTAKNPEVVLEKVLQYKSYNTDTLLYVTDSGAPAGKVQIKLQIKDKAYVLRTTDADSGYLLDLTQYSNDLYVVLGSSSGKKIYVYKDPVGQINNPEGRSLAPVQVLHVNQPNFVSFSSSAQFVVAENGSQFAVYDAENDKGFNYTAKQPLDQPQVHASWMDGNRLTYVSQGKLLVFDYDYSNQQFLNSASSLYLPAFAPDYKYVYTVGSSALNSAAFQLNQTALLTKADL